MAKTTKTSEKGKEPQEMYNTTGYMRLEQLVMEKIMITEAENEKLKMDIIDYKLEIQKLEAKLSVYERIASISNEKIMLGFGPPNSDIKMNN